MTQNASMDLNHSSYRGAALDVSFSPLGNQNAGTSSQAESRSSHSDHRSSRSGGKEQDRATTPSPNLHGYRMPPRQDLEDRKDESAGSTGGFLLGSVLPNGRHSRLSRRGKQRERDGQLSPDEGRSSASRLSADLSRGGSPLSREVSVENSPVGDTFAHRSSPRSLEMDPAQLVQMALNLSESRRRNIGGALQVPLISPTGKRVISGQRSVNGTLAGRTTGTVAHRLATDTANGSPSSSRSLSEAAKSPSPDDSPLYFSPATLSRAEKARKYFELASEHRRLLECLPSLKHDLSEPGSFTFPTTSRTASYANGTQESGRQYNPIQALRNRRLRVRERRPLTAPPEVWQDVDGTGNWIDHVEATTADGGFRSATDRVQLPVFLGDDVSSAATQDRVKGHRRTSTVGSIITRPENGWTVEPAELLADTYWTEKDNNKTLIEDHDGNKIVPQTSRMSTERPKKKDDLLIVTESQAKAESDRDDSQSDRQARRRVHLLPKRPKAFTRSRSISTASASSSDARLPPSLAHLGEAADENFGPLNRHMQQLIKEEETAEPSYPEPRPTTSDADHWDSKQTRFPLMHDGPMQARHRDTVSQAHERLSVEMLWREHRRARSADGRAESGAATALSRPDDSVQSDAPQSLFDSGVLSSMAMDLSSPVTDRTSSVQRKSKLRRLPFIRSHSKERNKIGTTDFADSQQRSSQEDARAPFMARHKTVESINGSTLQRNDTDTTQNTANSSLKEPSSTVGKLFKGGRIGEMVRSETSRYRSRGHQGSQLNVSATTSSDIDGDGQERTQITRDSDPTVDDESDASPRTSIDNGKLKQRYYLPNLPSFKSPSVRNKPAADSPRSVDESDPIGTHQRTPKNTRQWTTRFGQLAPPKINVPDGTFTTPELDSDAQLENARRKSYGFLQNGSSITSRKNAISFATPGLQGFEAGGMPTSDQPRLVSQGQRHWSISDQVQPQRDSKITARDVARVRALLLSSGVKARALLEQTDSPRSTPLRYIEEIATLVGKDLGSPSRRQEHMTAARMLSADIDSTTSSLQQALDTFSHTTVSSLASRLDALQRKAGDELTKLVNETSDDADAFTVELTTKQPQDVKRIDDAIDDLLRRRRRQFRMLRRTGFKVLEWMVLGIMWWMWFFVVVFKGLKRVIVGTLAAVRWLVTF